MPPSARPCQARTSAISDENDAPSHRDPRTSRRLLAPRGHPASRDFVRRRAVHPTNRIRGLPDGHPAAGTVPLCRRLRTEGRRHAAQRPEGFRGVTDVEAQGRARRARQRLLREARSWQRDVPRAADDPPLSRDLGRAPRRREATAEPQRPEAAARLSAGMGDRDVRFTGRIGRQGPVRVHQSA